MIFICVGDLYLSSSYVCWLFWQLPSALWKQSCISWECFQASDFSSPNKIKRSKLLCSINYLANRVREKLEGGSPWLMHAGIRRGDGFSSENTRCLRAFGKSKTKWQSQHEINTAIGFLWFILAVPKSVINYIIPYAIQWQVVLYLY